jgi:integrase
VTRWFHELCAQATIPRRRFHALRHSAATLMLAQRTPLEVISKTLGHAGYSITADVYAHVVPQLQREAADAMDRALAGDPR